MRFVKNQAGNIEETRYAYVGSSENNWLTVTKDYVEEEKIQEKKKRAPNPLRDLEGNRDLDGNQDRQLSVAVLSQENTQPWAEVQHPFHRVV